VILAIDTSTAQASVALSGETGVKTEISWIAGSHHSTQLFRALDALFDLSGSRIKVVSALAVATGPGSFSGIRVGMSASKAFALALDVPLTGVSTLDILAAGSCGPNACAIIPAGRGQYYLARYQVERGSVTRTSDYRLVSLNQLSEQVCDGDYVCCEDSSEVSEYLSASGISVSRTPRVTLRHASLLAELGRAYFAQGGRDQSHEAEPLYLRRSAAEEKRDAAQG
jgi:tRNA threonylcarbamoyladenosine biosynthesis protein TsaB